MRDEDLAGEAKRLIDAIAAKPRFAGSAEEAELRGFCASELRNAGFIAAEKEFEFSEWPGRWGIPLISAMLVAATAIVAAAASRDLALGGLAFTATFLLGQQMVRSRRNSATAEMRRLRSHSVNLEATRGSPHVWLVAHLDSKSQSVPMLVRVACHVALVGVVVVETATLVFALWGVLAAPHWSWIAAAALVSAIPSLFCFVGNKSRGALDNATGVAAVLLAARLLSGDQAVGVLITSGEELDLAGARAWAAGAHPGAQMINCDTVDDEGGWRCMYENRPHALGIAAEKAAKKLGLTLRMGKVIPGIITDSLAFEAAGFPSVTVSRGTLRTLARLHTREDNPGRVSGDGAVTAARLLARMVEELS
jgi:hypothetical protein